MSFNLEGAFNQAVHIQSKPMTFYQVSSNTEVTIEAAPSNYFRNFEMLEEMVSEGREFVITRLDFVATALTGAPVRGDRLIHADLGNYTVKEAREMLAQGNIIGYRLRCD